MYRRAVSTESGTGGGRLPARDVVRRAAAIVLAGGLLGPAGGLAQEGAPPDSAAPADAAAPDTVPKRTSYGECPDEVDGPGGADGVAWGDTLAALSRLATELDAEPVSSAGVDTLLRRGDAAFGAGHHTMAYVAYAAAARADGGYEALWRASRAAVDVGQDAGDDAATGWYRRAEEWGRRAADARPGAPEGHLHLAQALGLVALDAGVRDRVRLSEEIRAEARAAIEADSSFAGGWHVLGRWNKGVMELSGAGRFFARTFLGGEVLGEASWEKAARYLERAGELEPGRIVHHLEVGKVYLERDRPDAARDALEAVLSLPARDYHDCVYRQEARALLDELDPG